MLDQSFSANNFRKIFDIENRRGRYLESELFPDIEAQSRLIQASVDRLRQLRSAKDLYPPDEYEAESANLLQELDDLREKKEQMLTSELAAASAAIASKSFSFSIEEVDVGTARKAFVAERNAATFFSLKQIQHNIRRLYRVKQANRHQIVCQLRELLGDSFPKYIIRTDVSSFYESIPRRPLLRKLNNDPLLTLTSKKIIRRILFEYGRKTGSDIGLPRGIGISAYLAELYMRDIDNSVPIRSAQTPTIRSMLPGSMQPLTPPYLVGVCDNRIGTDNSIRNYAGVLYYARYVDDMFIIFSPPPNVGTLGFRRAVASALRKYGLKRNRNKTTTMTVDPNTPCSIEYLGYKFEMQSGTVSLTMTAAKIGRYKRRIDLSLQAYSKKATKSEKRARALLEKRIRFLTGNTRLVNNKKNVVCGIYFSNSLLTADSDLRHLDGHLQNALAGISNMRLRNRLLKNSFVYGFETRKYYKFSTRDLSEIVEVWKHVS